MICSMTAFARRKINSTWGIAVWEVRSVNQRYLETHINLPEQFRDLEPTIRERIRHHITRGKVDCTLCFDMNLDTQRALILNKKFAKELVEAAKWVKMQSNEGEIDPLAILCWPGVMALSSPNLDAISVELLSGLNATLNDFISVRKTEGDTLIALIEQRLAGISAEVANIRQHMPVILNWQRERLLNKLEKAKVQLDVNRLEQELIMLMQRIDVAEELDRLDAHVKETYKVLTKKEAVGRRLDFMMQEFNREANTLASKSISVNVTASAIELKVLIEQIREQIQNIE